MSWRLHGRANVNSTAPRAFGACDRCGFVYLLDDLKFQYDWRGNQVVNIEIRVCKTCYDKPYQGNRPLKLPPDPVPVRDPRPIRADVNEQAVSSSTAQVDWDEPGVMWDEPGILWDGGGQ